MAGEAEGFFWTEVLASGLKREDDSVMPRAAQVGGPADTKARSLSVAPSEQGVVRVGQAEPVSQGAELLVYQKHSAQPLRGFKWWGDGVVKSGTRLSGFESRATKLSQNVVS